MTGISGIGICSNIGIGNKGSSYWTPRKPYFTIDNTGNNQALVDSQVKITLTGADVTIASIAADGSNLYFYYKNTFLHSYINYLSATVCECYVKVSCPAFSYINIGLKLQTHAFVNDYANVMVRRSTHSSTNMLYTCADAHDSLAHGPDITLGNGATVASTKFGNVYSFDGSNDYGSLDIIKTIPDYGGFGFNFVLPDNSWDDGTEGTVFEKDWSSTKWMNLKIKTNGLFEFTYGWDYPTTYGSWTSQGRPEIGKIHSFYIRWTKLSTTVYLDGVIILGHNKRIVGSPTTDAGTRALFFASYSALVNNIKCYIFDIEYNNLSLPIINQRANAENIGIFNRTQSEKLTFLSNLPTAPIGAYWGEGTLIIEDDIIKCYHQKSYSDADKTTGHNIFCLSTSDDFGLTWNAPQTLMGYGTAVENTTGIYQPFTFKDVDEKWYVIYNLASSFGTSLKIRESVDGINFGESQTFITNTHGLVYNCTIINDNGIYKGLIDVAVVIDGFTSYVQYYIEGDSLYTMAYGTTNPQTSMGLQSPYNFGASNLHKVGSKYINWFGVTPTATKALLPCIIKYSESDDPSSDQWTTKTLPIMEMDSQYADDQMQDFHITEYNGNCYIVVGKNNNVANTYIMAFYKYEGTLAQFIKDITVTHHI